MSSDKTAVKHDPAAIASRVYYGREQPDDEAAYDRLRGTGSYQVLRDAAHLHRHRQHQYWRNQYDQQHGPDASTHAISVINQAIDQAHDAHGYEPKKPEPGLEHLHVPGMYVPKGSQR
jgi:hypothetical protein